MLAWHKFTGERDKETVEAVDGNGHGPQPEAGPAKVRSWIQSIEDNSMVLALGLVVGGAIVYDFPGVWRPSVPSVSHSTWEYSRFTTNDDSSEGCRA